LLIIQGVNELLSVKNFKFMNKISYVGKFETAFMGKVKKHIRFIVVGLCMCVLCFVLALLGFKLRTLYLLVRLSTT
jgi:hypothetical protein